MANETQTSKTKTTCETTKFQINPIRTQSTTWKRTCQEEKLGTIRTSRIFADVLQPGANRIGVLEVSALRGSTTPWSKQFTNKQWTPWVSYGTRQVADLDKQYSYNFVCK